MYVWIRVFIPSSTGAPLHLVLVPRLSVILLSRSVNVVEQCHGECHAQELHYQDDHAYGSQQILIVIQPFLHFLKAAPVPEHVGGVPPTVLVMLLAAAIRNYFVLQGLVPVGVSYHSTAFPLCLDDVPGISQAYVVFWVVQSQPILEILFGILTHLICVHKEQDEQNHLRQKNYQQHNEELPERGRALLQQQHRQYCKLNLWTKLWTAKLLLQLSAVLSEYFTNVTVRLASVI